MSKAKKKCWSESFGSYGSTIRVAEREPGGVLYLLWIDNLGKQRKRSLGHRDRKLGRTQGLALAGQLSHDSSARICQEPLSLAQGIERAFSIGSGMYPTVTRHSKEARRLVDRAASILGPRMRWTALTPGKIQYLVRILAGQSTDGRGARAAMYMCDMLYCVAAWLRQEDLTPETAALPKRNWKVRVKHEWETLTGRRIEPKRPRHTVAEVSRIFAALRHADPRLRLLIELAAELRAGQAVRARRSDLILDSLGGFGLGRFVVHGAGKKHGEVVDLHPELRALVDDTLNGGYLAEAERSYRRGEIEDFFLFPAGRLKAGVVPMERCRAGYLCSTAIRDMFRRLEHLAGVEHQAGRSFYGLRRQATDLAPEFEHDGRVLNRLTGHLDSATRERIYQDPENELMGARAAKARRKMRQHLRSHGIEVSESVT